jgi:hypothetical protein
MRYISRFSSFLVIILVFYCVVFTCAGYVYGEESTSSGAMTNGGITQRVEERASRIQEIRASAREKFGKAKEVFDTRVAKLRNREKEALLTNLVNKLAVLNEKWINYKTGVIARLSRILEKMDARAVQVETTGGEISDYEKASSLAGEKIENAQMLLQEQAGRVYVPEITTEDALGDVISKVTVQFRNDSKKSHEAVNSAREAVVAAFDLLKQSMALQEEGENGQ